MNFAAHRVSHVALLAGQRGEPALAGRPVALIGGEGRQAVITEVSPEARRVAPGLAVPLAAARCPGLQLRERDPAAEVEAQRLLLAAAFALSPRVEVHRARLLHGGLAGRGCGARTEAEMHRQILELRQLGLSAGIGAGETPLLARYAARCAAPVLIVRERADFLRPLPLGFAPSRRPSTRRCLQGWGIKTLGELTALPKAEVGSRLGPEGARLVGARPAAKSPPVLRLTEPSRTFVAAWNYEAPVESVEPLLFKLRPLRRARGDRAAQRGAGGQGAGADPAAGGRDGLLPAVPAAGAGGRRGFVAAGVADASGHRAPEGTRGRRAARRDTGAAGGAPGWPLRHRARRSELPFGKISRGSPRWSAMAGWARPSRSTPTRRTPSGWSGRRPPVPAPEAAAVHPPRGGVLAPLPAGLAGPRPLGGGAADGARRRGAGRDPRVRRDRASWRAIGGKPAQWAVETWEVELAAGGLYQLSRDGAGWWIDGTLD